MFEVLTYVWGTNLSTRIYNNSYNNHNNLRSKILTKHAHLCIVSHDIIPEQKGDMLRDKWPVYHTIMCEVDTPTTKVTQYICHPSRYIKKHWKCSIPSLLLYSNLLKQTCWSLTAKRSWWYGNGEHLSICLYCNLVIAFAI